MITFLQTVLILAFCKNSLCNYSLCNKSEPVCLPLDYDKSVLPELHEPNRVKVSIHVDEVINIIQEDSSILFSGYFNVEWNEQRLNMNPEFGAEFATPNSTDVSDAMVPMGLEFINGLWVPNIFIYNLKTYKVISVLNKLAGLWISPNKQVLYRKTSYIETNFLN